MFALHTPQSVTLAVPGKDGPFTTINFRTNGADTSRCVMDIITPDGDVHRLTFTTRGALVDQQYIGAGPEENQITENIPEGSYFVDGRDVRADNPYTHVAPVDADTAYRDGQTPGTKTQETDEQRTEREKVYAEADKARVEQRKAAAKRTHEMQKQAGIRVPDGGLKTAEDTTAKDVSWDAPHKSATPGDNPFTGRQTEVNDETWSKPGTEQNDPMVPSPSTALPGGEPAHPQSVQGIAERGKVNTTQSMTEPTPDWAKPAPPAKPPAGFAPPQG